MCSIINSPKSADVSRTETIARPYEQVLAILQSPETVCHLSPLCLRTELINPPNPYLLRMTDKVPILCGLSTTQTFKVTWVKTADGITSDVIAKGVTQFTTFKAVPLADGATTSVTITDHLVAPWWILWFVKERSYAVKTEMFESLPTAPLPSSQTKT